jgi:hypothetical protein
MSQHCNAVRIARSLALSAAFALTLSVPAFASVASEQQEGAQIQSAIHAGTLNSKSLSTSQYGALGEYLMGQALGSTASHERMNSLMGQMMGSNAVDQMHVYLGERYLGKSAQISGRYAPMYGLIGMMTRYRGTTLSTMMSGYLNDQSQSSTPHSYGPGMMGNYAASSSGSTDKWPTGAIIATAVLAALLLGGMAALVRPALRRRGGRRPRGGPASTPVR